MSITRRIQRFERLSKIDERKQQETSALLAVKAAEIRQTQWHIAEIELEQKTALTLGTSTSPASRIHLQFWLEHSEIQVSALRAQLSDQQQSWAETKRLWQQQEIRIKAWQRLREKLGRRLVEHEAHLDMQLADEVAARRSVNLDK